MLSDIIGPKQMAFLPFCFILDNIVLTRETIHFAKSSRQHSIFLKLDFSKAYDKVSWHFLFHTMKEMKISEMFIGWVKLLFGNAKVVVNLNGTMGEEFKIGRGVRHGSL